MKAELYLYGEPAAPALDLPRIKAFLEALLPLNIHLREGFFSFWGKDRVEELALGWARAKVRDPMKQDFPPPLHGEVEFEKRRLLSPRPLFGLVYDGFLIRALCHRLLPRQEGGLSHIHVIFTNQLLGTWEEARYHIRTGVFGFPTLLSTMGAVEGPARPREYYVLKQQFAALGMGDAAAVKLEQEFRERALVHDDPRLTQVMQGFVLQALFYHLTGEAFCPERTCPLYNAHWQEEMLQAQLKGELCPHHQEELRRLRSILEASAPTR